MVQEARENNTGCFIQSGLLCSFMRRRGEKTRMHVPDVFSSYITSERETKYTIAVAMEQQLLNPWHFHALLSDTL